MSVEKTRILLVTNELTPYLELTDFAQILNKLAIKTFDSGIEVRVIMPRFGLINERRHRLHEVVRLSGINITVDGDDYPLIIKVASLPNARLQVYFMDNEDFYKRKFAFHDADEAWYDDNAERAIFFCKSALETVKKFGWPPHLIHCHGWMASLLPVYLKTAYKKEPVFKDSKVMFTAQNSQFEEKMPADFVKKAIVNADIKEKDLELYKEGTHAAMTRGAVKCADIVLMGEEELDPTIAAEVKPGRTKKVIPYDATWKEDISPLLQLYKSLTAA